ncbi:hypothetical protein BT93_J1885 [Corymbia citriodora subsp. variegata]|nr:hypothetical protein BT93_J1885 [Corymbia citriodora subsp. variegata]
MVQKVKIKQLSNQIKEFANPQISKHERLNFTECSKTKATSYDCHLSGYTGKGPRCFCFHQFFSAR